MFLTTEAVGDDIPYLPAHAVLHLSHVGRNCGGELPCGMLVEPSHVLLQDGLHVRPSDAQSLFLNQNHMG